MSEEFHSTCPRCGTRLQGLHCKLVCTNCGYREDCSDLFSPEQESEPVPPQDQPDA